MDPNKLQLFKTELCRNWQEMGHCRYGTKCRFAHGEEELRNIERHAKYKTEICKTFHLTGTCLYGVRCTFIHDEQTMSMTPSPSTSTCSIPKQSQTYFDPWKSNDSTTLWSALLDKRYSSTPHDTLYTMHFTV